MKSFALGGQARIGSAPVSEVVVERDRVSPLHALITFEGDAYWVEDKQSQYGTFVNGNRIGKTKLRHFDVLTIAPDVNLVFLTTLPGSARVETNAEAAAAGTGATIEVAVARAPVADAAIRPDHEPADARGDARAGRWRSASRRAQGRCRGGQQDRRDRAAAGTRHRAATVHRAGDHLD